MYAGADTATHFSFRPGFCTLGTPDAKCTFASGAWWRTGLEALEAFMAFIAGIRAIFDRRLRAGGADRIKMHRVVH